LFKAEQFKIKQSKDEQFRAKQSKKKQFKHKLSKRRYQMQELDNKVGYMIHKVDMGVKKILDATLKEAGYDEATLMHGWILKYLHDNSDRDIYQRDIEKQFGIGRSTVTTIIQLMEKREGENTVEIEPCSNGFNVTFNVTHRGNVLMSLTVYAADLEQAEQLKSNFLRDPAHVYSTIAASLFI
jgi:DNA-binding MarR family transcriptional regulator